MIAIYTLLKCGTLVGFNLNFNLSFIDFQKAYKTYKVNDIIT